jgi:hypothetical protein
MYLDNLLAKVGRWKEEEFKELQRRARERAGPLPEPTPITCSDIGKGLTYAGGVGFALSLVPGVGWVGVFASGATTVAGVAAQLGNDTGVC